MNLFGTAGIRKIYPDEVNPHLAYRLGLAVAEVVGGGNGYLVHDTRITSPALSLAFMSGLMAGGMNAFYIGLAPTPIAAYASMWHGRLGVSVTASHNPPEYNGFKFYDHEGYEYTRRLEERIESVINEAKEREWFRSGKFYFSPEIVDEYIEDAAARLEPEKKTIEPRIVLDLANGAGSTVTPTILRKIGARVYTINGDPDGFFKARHPEPRKDVLEEFLPAYKAFNPDLVLAHDGDADRLAALSPRTGFIRQDRLIAFYAALMLRERRGTIVVSVDTGRVIDEVVERLGGRVERCRLGKIHEKLKEIGASNVVLAAEPWKLIDPVWGPWVDGIWQAGLLTKAIIEEGKPLDELLEAMNIPDYPWDRRSYRIEPKDLLNRVYQGVVEGLSEALGEPSNVLEIDGVRYEYEDYSWILVRMSGTEPKIRIYAEAKSHKRLREIIDKAEGLLVKTLESCGGKVIEKSIG